MPENVKNRHFERKWCSKKVVGDVERDGSFNVLELSRKVSIYNSFFILSLMIRERISPS